MLERGRREPRRTVGESWFEPRRPVRVALLGLSAADHGPLLSPPTCGATASRGREPAVATARRASAKIAPLNNERKPPRTATTRRAAAARRAGLAGADLKCGERDPLGAISPPDFASPTALAMASAHLWASPPWREEAAARGWSCRGEMWVRRAGATPPPGRYAACVAASGWCPAESRRDIDKDVPRTFGLGGMNLRELEPHLRRVLMAYAVADPETAYCQGMGFVAGAALLPFVTESQPPSAADEERAFAWLGFMVNGPLAGCYSSGMAGLAAHQQALRELLQRRRPALVAHLDDLGCPIECFTAPLLLKGFQQLLLLLALEAMDLLAARRVSALQLVLAVCEHAAPAMTRAKDAIDVQNALAQACDMRMRLRTLVDAHVGGRERCMRRRSVRCRRCPRYLPVRQSPARADSGAAGPAASRASLRGRTLTAAAVRTSASPSRCWRRRRSCPPLRRRRPGPPRSSCSPAGACGRRASRARDWRPRATLPSARCTSPSRLCRACRRRRRGGPPISSSSVWRRTAKAVRRARAICCSSASTRPPRTRMRWSSRARGPRRRRTRTPARRRRPTRCRSTCC